MAAAGGPDAFSVTLSPFPDGPSREQVDLAAADLRLLGLLNGRYVFCLPAGDGQPGLEVAVTVR